MRRTLFSKSELPKPPYSSNYPIWMDSLWGDLIHGDATDIEEDEISIFHDVISHEVACYQPRGAILGPLCIESGENGVVDCRDAIFELPELFACESLRFIRCDATAMVVIEDAVQFQRLCPWLRGTSLLLGTGAGIPRVAFRRFLHRLTLQYDLPVYVLADNDTWGYFMASLLSRGLLAPQGISSSVGIQDVRFLGLTTTQATCLASQGAIQRPWNPTWDLRMQALKRYNCFSSDTWRNEFEQFLKAGRAMDLQSAELLLGTERFVNELVQGSLATGNYLHLNSSIPHA